MTQQEQQNWITQWYQQSLDYVLLFSQDWTIRWKNRECPMLRCVSDYSAFFNFSAKETVNSTHFTICYAGELYMTHLDVHTGAENESVYLVRIDASPYQKAEWENPAFCHETENYAAAMRSQIFGISNAVSVLYHTIEEYSDSYSNMMLEELMQQLNIIQGNCCKLMRPSVYLAEMSNYYQNHNVSGEALFLDRELSNFVESCRNVLGRTVRIHLETESYLRIWANRDRLVRCLLCIVVYLQRKEPKLTHLFLKAEAQGEETILSLTASSGGKDEAPSRHSESDPLYQTPLLSPEEQMIRLFCRTYQVTMLTTTTETQNICSLRFPACDESAPLSLHSPIKELKELQDDAFSIYQLILSDISSYRFY